MKWVIRVVLGVVALLLLGAATLFALGFRTDAGVSRSTVEIAAAPDVVFRWFEDPQKLKAWVGWLIEADQIGPDRQRWVMEDRNNGNAHMEIQSVVVVRDAPNRMKVHATSGEFAGDQDFFLTNLGGGHTRLDMTSSYKFDQWLARLMEPLVSHEVRVKMIEDLARLKGKIETMNTELEKLRGTWNMTSLEVNGKTIPAPMLAGSRMVIHGDRFESEAMGNVNDGVIVVDPLASPKTFDLVIEKGADAGQRSVGIYEIDANKWKVCFAPHGPNRPKEFSASANSGFVMVEYERADH